MNNSIEAIRDKVCSICVDSTDDGLCSLRNDEICAIEFHYKKLVELVERIDSENIRDYSGEMKKILCAECYLTDGEEKCTLRDDANCALERYFPLIVQTIRETAV
jgi:hypothetical protein